MKKEFLIVLAVAAVALSAGCSSDHTESDSDDTVMMTESESMPEETRNANPTELKVMTSFAGDDVNADEFEEAVDAWESRTGNIVVDASRMAGDEYKAKVADDFENGTEPDVLFFYTGMDASEIIRNGQVVSLKEIRSVYPDYGSNMEDDKLPLAMNGEQYVIPVSGVWEGLYVNKKVLAEAGVEIPGEDYTWEQFLIDCEAIKNTGKIPVALSLAEAPHYWFEFAVENYSGYEKHLSLPETGEDSAAQSWIQGLTDIKDLYVRGYLPSNTLSAAEEETFKMFVDGQAAFLIDGSWRMGDIAAAVSGNTQNGSVPDGEMTRQNSVPDDEMTPESSASGEKMPSEADEALNQFTVTWVPAKENRKATDLVGGCTMGYYITRKAWDDPEKREAAVQFVQAVTTDEMVIRFAGIGVTALKNSPDLNLGGLNTLQMDGYKLVQQATGWTGSVLNNMPEECRNLLLEQIVQVARGYVGAESVPQNYLNKVAELEEEERIKESEALERARIKESEELEKKKQAESKKES